MTLNLFSTIHAGKQRITAKKGIETFLVGQTPLISFEEADKRGTLNWHLKVTACTRVDFRLSAW